MFNLIQWHFLLHAYERSDTSISFSTVAIYLFIIQILHYLVHKITYAYFVINWWLNIYVNLQDLKEVYTTLANFGA